MTPADLFRDGRLTEALAAQEQAVAWRPDDAAARLLLAELHLFAGDFTAVRRQLDAIPAADTDTRAYLDAYHRLLDAEARRQRLFLDVEPLFLLPPPEHISWRLEALEHIRRGEIEEAVEAIDEADARCPTVSGHIDGREFHGARDGDDLFGPLLEVLLEDQYLWLPFEQISRLRLGEATCLRDLYFVPARLRSVSGDEWDVHLPALYPGAHLSADDEIRVGQATDWTAEGGGPTRGIGLRVLTFGEEELTLLDFTQWEVRST
jgi:type VI secretion system protein ImpE